LEALYRRMKEPSDALRVVCGDFNAPQLEPPNSPLFTFAQDPEAGGLRLKPERWYRAVEPTTLWDPERWDRAERQVLESKDSELVDVYRLLHPDGHDVSWVWRGRGREVGRRFDHVIASCRMRPTAIHYRHDWRQRRNGLMLSDHSAVIVQFEPC
ncbi:MAG: hypothetical protein M3P40_04280, partial [Actinomycetota bacterium]|nr:hypothetical protein [Actinomycetota bacterium]